MKRPRSPVAGAALLALGTACTAACTAALIGPRGGAKAPPVALGLAFPTTPTRSALEVVELQGLESGATALRGESFLVHSVLGSDAEDGRCLARADARGRFLLPPTWTHEDPAAEVSAYYHAMRYLAHYRRLGFRGFARPVRIAVNFRPGGNGNFLAGATDLHGGPGILVGQWGDRNLAFDPDVLGHELFHVVQASLTPPGEREVENEIDALGMNTTPMAVAEATADYFSCTLGGDPNVGEYSAEALDLPFLSTLAHDRRFPAARTGQPHHDDQVLSAALWEVRRIVGAERLDHALWNTLRAMPSAARRGRTGEERTFTFPFVVARLLDHLPADLAPSVRRDAERVFARRGLTAPSEVVILGARRPPGPLPEPDQRRGRGSGRDGDGDRRAR